MNKRKKQTKTIVLQSSTNTGIGAALASGTIVNPIILDKTHAIKKLYASFQRIDGGSSVVNPIGTCQVTIRPVVAQDMFDRPIKSISFITGSILDQYIVRGGGDTLNVDYQDGIEGARIMAADAAYLIQWQVNLPAATAANDVVGVQLFIYLEEVEE